MAEMPEPVADALRATEKAHSGLSSDVYLVVGMVACVGGAALLASLAYVAWRRNKRQKLQKSYEQFPEDGASVPPVSRKTSIRSNVDPTFYVQNRTIDFVVPSIATALAPISSPPDAASLSSGSSPDIPLWAKLALLDNPSNYLGMPEGADLPGFRKHYNREEWTLPLDFQLPPRSPSRCSSSLSVLGGLNPELYKVETEEPEEEVCFPDGHRGRLWFGLEYDAAAERLVVNLVKAKNLPSRTYGSVNCCDPFVRISLMPDERRYLQSKLKKKNCNPKFDETFVFQVPVKMMEERILKLTVLDNDRGKRYNVIGHVLFPLKEMDLTSNEKYLLWRDLETDVEEILNAFRGIIRVPSELGEILVSLCYNQNLERLTLTVFEGRKLRQPEGISTLDTYVKVIFLMENKPVKSKKTVVSKRTTEPKYNESFNFRLAPGSLNSASLILQVNTVGQNHKDKLLGRVVLGSYMFVRGRALDHWNEMISAGHKQVRHWHKLTT